MAQKVAIQKIVINLPVKYRSNIYSNAVLNPSDPLVSFMLDTCSKILTNNDDITGFWFPYFISPIERGLNMFYETATEASHTGLAQPYPYRELYQERQQFHPADAIIYDKTKCSCLKLLKKLGYSR